jgi:hypothetical protein
MVGFTKTLPHMVPNDLSGGFLLRLPARVRHESLRVGRALPPAECDCEREKSNRRLLMQKTAYGPHGLFSWLRFLRKICRVLWIRRKVGECPCKPRSFISVNLISA